ncbi:RES family NAD+ phosphorylase [Marinobacter subterrani]|uniref:RES family NAD+ phosphorylase n=1 Tax=Marinobacter subterrani TaxID=1658765 RepID=UPI00235431E6|nr:RES family NAD+ phosphorylase [Marinobacter subterrani]
MPTLWRISNHEDLDGMGGLHTEGRWHPLGQRVVYLSEHPALALLEVMVHLEVDREDLPDSLKLLKVSAPDGPEMFTDPQLPDDWKTDETITQKAGLNWLTGTPSPMLRVPSAILPESTNILLNPLHPRAAQTRIVEVINFPFDSRLTGG